MVLNFYRNSPNQIRLLACSYFFVIKKYDINLTTNTFLFKKTKRFLVNSATLKLVFIKNLKLVFYEINLFTYRGLPISDALTCKSNQATIFFYFFYIYIYPPDS